MGVLSSAEAQSKNQIGRGMNILDKLKAGQWLQVLRYLVVGGLNTAMSLGVYFISLYFFGWPYYVASAVSILAGIAVGFKAHGAFVFGSRGRFWRYVLCWGTIYAGNTMLIALLRDYTGDYWAQIILLPITTLLSYFLMKKLVYTT